MKINDILSGNTKAVAAAPAVIILLLLGCGVVCCAFSPGPRPFLEMPDKEACVKDASYMRYRHMDLLKRVRDEVVREGKKGEVELDGCSECHTSRERFCNRCHDRVNLNPDCFRCHHYPD